MNGICLLRRERSVRELGRKKSDVRKEICFWKKESLVTINLGTDQLVNREDEEEEKTNDVACLAFRFFIAEKYTFQHVTFRIG